MDHASSTHISISVLCIFTYLMDVLRRKAMRRSKCQNNLSLILFLLYLVSIIQGYTGYVVRSLHPQRFCRKFASNNVDTAVCGQDLIASVQFLLSSPSGLSSPFIHRPDLLLSDSDTVSISSKIIFTNDLIKGQGIAEYEAMAQAWKDACLVELPEATSNINKVTMVGQNFVNVDWNVTFVPDSLGSLLWFCRRLPGVQITFFDVLNKERIVSKFSWVALRSFFERILYTGVALLPHAVIVGRTELTFRELSENDRLQDDSSEGGLEILSSASKRWQLVSSKEKINLVRSIDSGTMKNRKLAIDLLQFLDARRPVTVGLQEWNDVLVGRISTKGIPGMGQFDIDGL
jgi:hypothetical protein